MPDLDHEIKSMIISTLKLEDIAVDDIDSAAPLFGDGLGLDSIDALELGIAIRQIYGIKIDTVNEEIKSHFFSVESLSLFIQKFRSASS